jgi:PAS domain S-box-containing protein
VSDADLHPIRDLADHIPQLVWACLPDGRCDYLSCRWVDYTGVPEADHHGHGWVNALRPDDRPRARELWDRFIAGEANYDIEYRLRRHDGAYRWFKTRGLLLLGDDGSPRRIFGTATDIDDQKRAEADLRESRERLEAALAASGTGTFRWDFRSNVLDWDEQLDRLFGLAPGEAVPSLDHFIARVHPEDRAGVLEHCARCRDDGADFSLEFRVAWRDGTVRWLDDRGKTFLGPDGRPAYMTGACVDVTDRKVTEEALREGERRLRAAHDLLEGITEGTQELIAALDPDFRFSVVNAAYRQVFERVFGTEARVGGSMIDALAHLPEDRKNAIDVWRRALAGENVSVTMEFGDPGRERRVFDLRFSPIRDAAGRIIGAGEIARDVTDRVRAEEALKDADRRKDEFLALLAHELRNPLAPLRNGL